MTVSPKDLFSGLIFIAVGTLYGFLSMNTLSVGTVLAMGPGYFPLMLSVALVMLGVVVVARGFFARRPAPFGIVAWRAVLVLTLDALILAFCLRKLGLAPAMFLTAFLASMASPQTRLIPALLVSFAISVFCVAVFGYGIRLPLPIFGSWFGGV